MLKIIIFDRSLVSANSVYNMFIWRRQILSFTRSLLIRLLVEVHVFFLEDISRVFRKTLSIVYNLNKATNILGLS